MSLVSSETSEQHKIIPEHIAIVMDGNRRWARKKKLQLTKGHEGGAEALKKILKHCVKLGIPYLTVYAFSSENWNRATEEVGDLMFLMRHYLKREMKTLLENGVRIRVIGDTSRLPKDIAQPLLKAVQESESHQKINLTIALSYGARDDILQATRRLCEEYKSGEIQDIESIDESCFSKYLYTSDLPDPDLFIRPSGEYRISNFLLWQCAYTEFYFTDVLWPDFDESQLNLALDEFAKRNRRYGV